MIMGPQLFQWLVLVGALAVALYELSQVAGEAVKVWERRCSAEHDVATKRLELDRYIFDRTHPQAPTATKRTIIVPPEIEEQLADAPEWEREDTRARAVELYEDLERKYPDEKAPDRWARVHKLLELETEAVESAV